MSETSTPENFNPATFTPLCIVCGQPSSPKRRRGQTIETCSSEHHAMVTAARKFARESKKCKLCYKPSTPEERAQFKAWRRSLKASKFLATGGGRPPRWENEVLVALAESLVIIRRLGELIELEPAQREFVNKFSKLIDGRDIS